MSRRAREAETRPAADSGWAPLRVVLPRLLVVGALVALDLWSKAAVFGWLEGSPGGMSYDAHGHERYPLVGEWLTFMLSLNPGAAWGKLDSIPHLLVAGRCLAVVFLTWLLLRTPPGRRALPVALVLILAGAMGNLHDNLFLKHDGHPFGKVRDFIDVYFPIWDWHFPTFNVADACITVGAGFLLVSCFGPQEEAAEEGSLLELSPPVEGARATAGVGTGAGESAPRDSDSAR